MGGVESHTTTAGSRLSPLTIPSSPSDLLIRARLSPDALKQPSQETPTQEEGSIRNLGHTHTHIAAADLSCALVHLAT
jgi:hypothetical protein